MNKNFTENIKYCLIDAARAGKAMKEVFSYDIRVKSLYEGRREEIFADVAPYLTEMVHGSSYNKWLIDNGWGKSWGVLIISSLDFDALLSFFKNFIHVEDTFGKTYFFRFYDPRVLRKFLPSCDDSQLKSMFEGVEHYIVEDENPEKAIDFYLKNGKLQTRTIDVNDAGNNSVADKKAVENKDIYSDFETIV
jgi:hypothetical protein